MNGNYLLDTNVLIYHSSDSVPGAADFLEELLAKSFNISVISVIEYLGWKGFSTPDFAAKASSFISHATVFGLEQPVIDRAVHLRRVTSTRIPDAIIAATAWVHGMQLVTANVKDFKNTGVRIINLTRTS